MILSLDDRVNFFTAMLDVADGSHLSPRDRWSSTIFFNSLHLTRGHLNSEASYTSRDMLRGGAFTTLRKQEVAPNSVTVSTRDESSRDNCIIPVDQ
ncbi:hypothetical protein J6590_048145 [Homalodisca vitripennis]|nr:hypothetical protein J6590_048145 [Homalodisca vitripennis]